MTTHNGAEESAERIRSALEAIAVELVNHPDDVKVEKMLTRTMLVLTVTTREGEAGQVIGKNGAHAKALRSLTEAMASRHGLRAVLDVPDR